MTSKTIAIVGSTGSIGTQALEVVRQNAQRFSVALLSAQQNVELLTAQALEFNPKQVIIGDESLLSELKARLSGTTIKVSAGAAALVEAVVVPEIDLVLTALVGFAGLEPTLAAITAGKDIALANKETLVVAGDLVTRLAKQHGVQLLPVDSEHSAIFQCLVGEHQPIEKLILTASGGPFRGKDTSFLGSVSPEQALKHPNWVMGAKITIDSASLMNKGLEVIEAKWLFDVQPEQIEVVVHPQSIVHSLVQFTDGSIKAQLGLPDMKLPIQYALGYPERIANTFKRFNFIDYPTLSFEQADTSTFRNLGLAYDAIARGGNVPCILNAANEVVVSAFLAKRIGFLAMSDVIATCMDKIAYVQSPSLSDYLQTDKESRQLAERLVTN
ncbi:MAG: 1-deoxy-D-xylulose-5-phosphate reductoisomerase [Sphingobacteriaceae bacterium]